MVMRATGQATKEYRQAYLQGYRHGALPLAAHRPHGFGIVDKDGNPWWDEACVCEDREALEEQLVSLNDDPEGDPRCPYRVVRLVSVDLESP